jgi:hypothetical protein
MTITTRAMLALALMAGCLAVAMVFRPHWLTEKRPQPSGSASSELSCPPDERCLVIAHRLRMKNAIVHQVVDGELSLLEAAAQFRSLRGTDSLSPDTSWLDMPGKSDGEKVCRQVIAWVVSELEGSPREYELPEAQARLEKELEALLARDGEVHLPSP